MITEPTTRERTSNIRVPLTLDEMNVAHANAREIGVMLKLRRTSTAAVIRHLLLNPQLLEVRDVTAPATTTARKTRKAS